MIKTMFWISAGAIGYAYVVYPLLLLMLSKIHSRPKAGEKSIVDSPLSIVKEGGPETLPLVSMVISAYNEEKIIGEKIKNILAIDYPKDKFEVIIASDGCTDGTDEIIAKHKDDGIKLIRLNGRRGKVNALNNAVPQAQGEIIVFSDANSMYEPQAIRKLVRNFIDKKVGCVSGELLFKDAADSETGKVEGFYWRYEQFMKRCEGSRGSLLGANGGIFAIRKDLFIQLPANTIVEDFVLPMKILEKGYKVVYEPEAVAYEDSSKHIVQEMERRIRIGAGDFQALGLTCGMIDPRRGFSALAYFSHKVLRWFAPFFLIMSFLANAALVHMPFYAWIFIIQCLFYAAAVAGRILSRTHVKLRIFSLPYYFVSMNIALLLGFVRFCSGTQSVAWKRTDR